MSLDLDKVALKAALQELLDALRPLKVLGSPVVSLDRRLKTAAFQAQDLLNSLMEL